MSPTTLRVAIVDAEGGMFQFLQQMICDLGHEAIAVTENRLSLIERCANLEIDVLITGALTPEMDEADALAAINESRRIPIILCADHCDRDLVLNAEHKQVFMYLVKPIRREHLEVALDGCRLEKSRQLLDDNPEDHPVLIAGSREYSGNARYRVPSGPSYSSAMFRVAH